MSNDCCAIIQTKNNLNKVVWQALLKKLSINFVTFFFTVFFYILLKIFIVIFFCSSFTTGKAYEKMMCPFGYYYYRYKLPMFHLKLLRFFYILIFLYFNVNLIFNKFIFDWLKTITTNRYFSIIPMNTKGKFQFFIFITFRYSHIV